MACVEEMAHSVPLFPAALLHTDSNTVSYISSGQWGLEGIPLTFPAYLEDR